MNKDELRGLFKQIRLRMSASELSTKNRLINRRLINDISWNDYGSICAYQPIKRLNEVDIAPLLNRLRNLPELEIGLIEPMANTSMPRKQFNLIIIPCLAFDAERYRLGWGGGWYDRFLVGQPGALKVGTAFENGLAESGLPHETHDVRMDMIITDAGSY